MTSPWDTHGKEWNGQAFRTLVGGHSIGAKVYISHDTAMELQYVFESSLKRPRIRDVAAQQAFSHQVVQLVFLSTCQTIDIEFLLPLSREEENTISRA